MKNKTASFVLERRHALWTFCSPRRPSHSHNPPAASVHMYVGLFLIGFPISIWRYVWLLSFAHSSILHNDGMVLSVSLIR